MVGVVLQFIARNGRDVVFRFATEDEARRFLELLGIGISDVKINPGAGEVSSFKVNVKWNEETKSKFILFLKSKRPPVRDEETIQKYLSCIERFLAQSNGIIDPDNLLKYGKTKTRLIRY